MESPNTKLTYSDLQCYFTHEKGRYMLLPPNCAKYLMHSHFYFIYVCIYKIYMFSSVGKITDHSGSICENHTSGGKFSFYPYTCSLLTEWCPLWKAVIISINKINLFRVIFLTAYITLIVCLKFISIYFNFLVGKIVQL